MGVWGLTRFVKKHELGRLHVYSPLPTAPTSAPSSTSSPTLVKGELGDATGSTESAAQLDWADATTDVAPALESAREVSVVGDGYGILYWLLSPTCTHALCDVPRPASTSLESPVSPPPLRDIEWALGGDYDALHNRTVLLVESLRHCGVHLSAVFLDGANDPEKFATLAKRRSERVHLCDALLRSLDNSQASFAGHFPSSSDLLLDSTLSSFSSAFAFSTTLAGSHTSTTASRSSSVLGPVCDRQRSGVPLLMEQLAARIQQQHLSNPSVSLITPPLAVDCFLAALAECGVPVIHSRHEADPELEQYCAEHPDCVGVLASDSDFLLSPLVPNLVHLESLRFREGRLHLNLYCPSALAAQLGLPLSALPLLGFLIGNDRTRLCRGLAWDTVYQVIYDVLREVGRPVRGWPTPHRPAVPRYSCRIDVCALFLRKQVAVAGPDPVQLERRVVNLIGSKLSRSAREVLADVLLGCSQTGCTFTPVRSVKHTSAERTSTERTSISAERTPASATGNPLVSSSSSADARPPLRSIDEWIDAHQRGFLSPAVLDLVAARVSFQEVTVGGATVAAWSAPHRHRFLARTLSSTCRRDCTDRNLLDPPCKPVYEWAHCGREFSRGILTLQPIDPAPRCAAKSVVDTLRQDLRALPLAWPPSDSPLPLLLGAAAVRMLCVVPHLERWEAELLLRHVCERAGALADTAAYHATPPRRECARAVVIGATFQSIVGTLLAEIRLFTAVSVEALPPQALFSGIEWCCAHVCADSSMDHSFPGAELLFAHPLNGSGSAFVEKPSCF